MLLYESQKRMQNSSLLNELLSINQPFTFLHIVEGQAYSGDMVEIIRLINP